MFNTALNDAFKGDALDRHDVAQRDVAIVSNPIFIGLEMLPRPLGRACALVLTVATFACPASAATLVNGDFETGDFTGWSVALTENGTNAVQDIVSFDTNQNGAASNAANFQVGRDRLNGEDGGISFSQTFSVTSAGVYNFGVDVAGSGVFGGNSDGGTFALLVAGFELDTFVSDRVNFGQTKGATLAGALDLAIGDYVFDILITRRFFGDNAFAQQFIDDAFITGPVVAPVPLPASSLLLLGGLAGFGAMRRRQAR